MRAVSLLLLGLALTTTAFAATAAAEAVCTPLGAPAGGCVGASACHTRHTEGVCAGGFLTGVGAVRATCQHHDMAFGFCSAQGGAQGHGAGANVGCQQVHGVGCHGGAGAGGIGGAHAAAGSRGVCAGAGVRALEQGAGQCVPLPHL